MKTVLIFVLICLAVAPTHATLWSNFTELSSVALPGPQQYNSISTMVVDDTTTPYTGYFTAYREAASAARLYKFTLNNSTILKETDLGVGDANPSSTILDKATKMLYFVPFNSRTIIKFSIATNTEVARIDLSKAPHNLAYNLVHAAFYETGQQIIYSVDHSPAIFVRLDLAKFNLTGSPLEITNASYPSCGFVDNANNMAYFGAKTYPSKVLLINLLTWELVKVIPLYEDYYGVPISMVALAGCAFDPVNKYGYFSDSQDPGRIARVSTKPGEEKQLGAIALSVGERAPPTMLIDQAGGNMIVGCSENILEAYTVPERIVLVDLSLFRRVDSISTRDYEVTLKSGVFDPVSRTCYFGTNREVSYFAWAEGPDHLVRVTVPAPCGGDTDCSGHGVCDYGSCHCSGGLDADRQWSGATCDTLTCPTGVAGKVCSDNGMCNNGTCVCTTDAMGHTAFGDDCFNVTCPNYCSAHGTCNAATLKCACGAGWKGADCSIAIPPRPPCHENLNCSTCFQDPACGWCEASANGSRCMDGTFIGPTSCYDWYYDACPDVGVVAFSWIMVGLTVLLLLVGSISAIKDDRAWTSLADDSDARNKRKMMSRVSWWRGSRTLKGWWMMDRLQMAALVGLVGTPMPSIYMSFVKPYAWTILGIQPPAFVLDMLTTVAPPSTTRTLLSMPQYAAQLGVTAPVGNALAIFASAIFYFAVLLGGVFFILMIFTLVGFFVGWTEGTNEGPATLPYRVPGVLLRVLLFSYTGLVGTAAAAAFAQAQNVNISPAVFAVSLVVLALFGLIMPTTMLLVFKSKKVQRKQFQRKFRMLVGCLYENYYFKRAWFGAVYLWKKFLLAVMIGVFSQTSDMAAIACAAIIIVVCVIYAVVVLALKPFLDPMMRNLEILGCVADVFAGICVLFFTPNVGFVGVGDAAEFSRRNTIAMILIIVQIVWVVFGAFAYFENWLRVHNVHTYAQLFRRLTGRHKEADVSGPIAVPMGNVQSTSHLD